MASCERHMGVIGDGWHHGPTASAERSFADSLVGLTTATPPISYVGIDEASNGENLVIRASGGTTGETWANALLALGKPSVVVGHPGSSATNAAARVYAKQGVPLIVPNGTARVETEIEDWVFRLLPTDDTQGRFMADYAVDSLGSQRVVVVFAGDAYGVGILRGIRASLAGRGLPLADELELPVVGCGPEPISAPRLAARAMLRRSRPDVLIVALPLEPANCVIAEVLRGSPTVSILGADALDETNFDRWVRTRVPGASVRVVTGWRQLDDAQTRRFNEAFARRYGTLPRGGDALHHDALLLAATAIRETDGSPERVRGWLASLGGTRDPIVGLTGPIAFSGEIGPRLHIRTVQ
jgi:branched-chain amino acid transport system substrate-binding protein